MASAAAQQGSAVILTSDPEGIAAYLAVLNPPDIHVMHCEPGTGEV
ncbi:hypothetical protein AB0K47_21355 [Streptomyces tirandamycinicus]